MQRGQRSRQFADKGGNMLIIGEPGKQEIVNPVLAAIAVFSS